MNAFVDQDAASSPLGSGFALAAWVAIIGVCVSWFYLKQDTAAVAASLPELPRMMAVAEPAAEIDDSPLALAEEAYAAGRIVRPRGDSALDYYRQAAAADPNNPAVQQGLERVMAYLINSAEEALGKEDLQGARDFAEQALAVQSGNRAARSVMDRVALEERLKTLIDSASEQVAAGRLTRPDGDNALGTYREILRLAPGNVVAQQGLETVAQRLATIAQSEAFAENHDRAKALLSQAKDIAPNAPGIAETEKLTTQWSQIVKDQVFKEDLLAAARAMRERRYVGDARGPGALDYYRSALKVDPNSAAAQSGVDLAINGLVERIWELLNKDDIAAATSALAQADQVGATGERVAQAREELSFLRERERAFRGEFEGERAIGELTARYQQVPVVPPGVGDGYAELLFTVNVDGQVEDIEIVGVSHDRLEKPVLKAVKRWRFEPYEERGRVMPVRTGVRFTFQE